MRIVCQSSLLYIRSHVIPETLQEPSPAQANEVKVNLSKPPPAKVGAESACDLLQLGVSITSVSMAQPLPPVGDAADDGKLRRKLKSLQGLKHRTTEWFEMAETITKVGKNKVLLIPDVFYSPQANFHFM